MDAGDVPRMSRTRIDHIGIIVADLGQAIARLQPLFGTPVLVKEIADAGLRVAEFDTANVRIELLQYTGTGDAFARRTMGERLGLNHISAEVADVEGAVATLCQQGFRPLEGFPREGAHGRVAFFAPDAVTGLLFEVCQPHSPRWPAPAAEDPDEGHAE
jgi:methylmalonyl-CoA epimerase